MAHPPRLSKQARVGLILAGLKASSPASSRDEALSLIDRIFRLVEDGHSGVPHDPYDTDRLYPPVASMERQLEGTPALRRYRHTGHYTLIADNGAIVIRVFRRGMLSGVMSIIGEETVLDHPSSDGRRVGDFE